MIRNVAWLLVAVALSLTASGASAQETAGATAADPATTGTADGRLGPKGAPPAGSILGRHGLPIARDAVQRGQRSFRRCNEEALIRKLRGAERRHFVARCRLGYGRRLFRRATPPA